ncbi:phosphoribosylamine-glycine ligase [Capronia coronata CBS 617.96]|uniref:phosphoribosylamine--glycine ligase n=1 Tax=Capronia coronata CBS 617.96 TaxID=1182541 RepID=W9YNS4_9EURO|nr:phosphoribosylamine-glycine ligase [Capronia coronata CBS 617.96]EXJ90856.1 phosphoribosylamine-glycine ligase [Capronia coronata CBS 617.96]
MRGRLRVLIIGKGGREHALAWKLRQSPLVDHVYVLPGNGGTARGLTNVSNVENVAMDQYEAMAEVAIRLEIGLAVIGPDSAIVDGAEVYFRRAKIPCFAPSKEAAEIEGSKAYAKEFMCRHGIPTAEYRTFTDFEKARAYVDSVGHRVVIKADGLATGKGVMIPSTKDEAVRALQDILVNHHFGGAGTSVVVEEYLVGQELSVSTVSDGETTVTLSVGQDHKRVRDGDMGPNTGGMGVYAPVPAATRTIMERVETEILRPTFEGLRQEGRVFKGLLFTGIMLTDSGPKVLEYNARFGDPETQSIIPLLGSDVDLALVLLACTKERLHEMQISFSPGFACNVVVAAGGYPESFRSGDIVEFEEPLPGDCLIFHSGTKLDGECIVTAGGRVFTVVGLGGTLAEAVSNAYRGVRSIEFPNMFYRKDIAWR